MTPDPTDARPTVLITGCSSGIGRAVALHFAGAGFRVFASMRRAAERGPALRAEAEAAGGFLRTPELDVASDASVASAVAEVLAATGGRLDVLVNNAGYYAYGPLEEVAPDQLRAQLETNLLGVHRVTRAVLPAMRARGAGRVITVGSLAGRVAVPVLGPYQISKWGVEAWAETLRLEVAPFGIDVVCVEPGPFATALHDNEARLPAPLSSPYAPLMAAYDKRSQAVGRSAPKPVVRAVYRAATNPRPKLRWPVGRFSWLATTGRRLISDRMYGWLVGLVFGWRRRRPRGFS